MSGVPSVSETVPSALTRERHRGVAAEVEPEAAGDAAPLVLAERRLVVGMVARRLQRLAQADAVIGRPERGFRAFMRRILEPHLDRVDADPAGQLLDDALDRERRHRRTRRPVGSELGPVGDDVVADDADVIERVAGERRHGAELDQRARERAALEFQLGLAGGDLAVAPGADLDADARAGRRAGGAENLVPAHHQLHGTAGLARQGERDRLDEHGGLAAEAAADLRGRHAQARGLEAEQRRAGVADHVGALGAYPDLAGAVGAQIGQARVRLDVALVAGLGAEGALDHDIGLGEALGGIAVPEMMLLGDVRGLAGLRRDAFREQRVVQDGGIRPHGGLDIGDVGQDLVVHRDERQGFARQPDARGRDGGNGVSVVEGLAARHDVGEHRPQVRIAAGQVGEVGAGDDRLDAVERERPGGVDRTDARMRMRAAQDCTHQHAGSRHIGAEAGATRHLVDPVRAHGPRAHHVELRLGCSGLAVERHASLPRLIGRPMLVAPVARGQGSNAGGFVPSVDDVGVGDGWTMKLARQIPLPSFEDTPPA